jgi:monoamine oxidase
MRRHPNLTRRGLMHRLAGVAGAGAAYEAMMALNLLPVSAEAAAIDLPPASGAGKSVAVLGAGISGLCAAYELDRAGYSVSVLEANSRPGGRSLTLRRGDALQETGDSPRQVCGFDEGLWLNAGPGRIAHHNVHMLAYCRQLDIALEPFIFASRAGLIRSDGFGNGGRTVPIREALYSLQGHVAELLDKCVQTGSLDEKLTGEDVRRLNDMLVRFGDLSPRDAPGAPPRWEYRNATGRAGFAVPPGLASAPAKPLTPMALDEILRSEAWTIGLFNDTAYEWQSSLLQPVGGMDMFWKGFMRQPLSGREGTIAGLIRYGCPVRALETAADKVTITFDEAGSAGRLAVDYCISTIPMPIFRTLRTNLDARFMQAAADLPVVNAGKVGWQAERFWEIADNIYGGISWTSDVTEQIWYPSDGFLSAKGVLTGAYMRAKHADIFNPQPVAERLRIAREAAEALHPGKSALLEQGIAIAWDRMEHSRHGWANAGDPGFEAKAQLLSQPQGRLFLAGDQLTMLSGWQEGAVISARAAVQAIDRQARLGEAR